MSGQIDDPALADAFVRYFSGQVAGVSEVRVDQLIRIHGGASRQTYSIDLSYVEDGERVERALILRRDPPDSLIDTERRIEFAAIRSVAGIGIPAPDALFLETETAPLGAPFFVMGRIDGGAALNPFRIDDIGEHRHAIGQQFFSHLGKIAAAPVEGSPLAAEIDVPALDGCWSRELGYWANEIRTKALRPEPIAEAAIRYLQSRPPPPAQRLSIVHGDFRSGNFLHDGEGRINAVLDWEMAHIGDPYEDLAWATDPLWCSGDTERAAGFLPWPDAIGAWQEASGCAFDPEAFEWWSMFAHLKAIAIWISSARAFAEGENDDPILAWSGWFTHAAHELTIASRLAPKFGLDLPAADGGASPDGDARSLSGVGMILDRIGRTLVMQVMPHLEGHYAGGHVSLSGLMAIMAGEAWDGAADRLHREIEGMRALLAAAGEASDEQPASLKLSDLEPVRNLLATRLIDLQARLERSDQAEDHALNARIWGFMVAGAAERMPSAPDFPTGDDAEA